MNIEQSERGKKNRTKESTTERGVNLQVAIYLKIQQKEYAQTAQDMVTSHPRRRATGASPLIAHARTQRTAKTNLNKKKRNVFFSLQTGVKVVKFYTRDNHRLGAV